MEEFLKLNWRHPLELDTKFVSAEALREKSLAFVTGSLIGYQSSDSSDETYKVESNNKVPRKKKKKKSKKSAKEKCTEKNAKEEGVRYSALTAVQHATFLEFLLKVQNQRVNIPAKIRKMKETIELEQNDFQDHLKKLWTYSFQRHGVLNEDAQKFTVDKWKMQLNRVKSYPKLYKLEKTVPLIYPPEYPGIEITPVKMLLEMGVVPKLHVPNVNLLPKISTNYTQMLLLNAPKPQDFESLRHVCVSMDKNAELLALKENADIVISSSGLKCLGNNVSSTFDSVWSLPVEVRTYKIKVGDSIKEHKIVYIDKKLPPKSMSTMERNAWFHKHAVKSFLFHPKDPQSFRYPEDENFDTKLEIIDEVKNALNTTENGSICKKCGCSLEDKGSENESDSDSISSLVIDIETVPATQTCMCSSDTATAPGNHDKLPIPPPSNSNVTYRLWKLFVEEGSRENMCEGLLKRPNLSPVLKILVRCKLDACEGDVKEVKPVCVSSKMEHQAEHGAEKLNLSMLVKEWLSLLLRPEASLTRIHINALTEEIFLSEKSSFRDLTCLASNQFDFRIKRSILGSLFQVMSDLMLLKPGQYLLTHDIRSGPFISVLQNTNKNVSYDLYADYESVNPSVIKGDKVPPWTPIDTNIITPMHIAVKRVPATFKPLK